MKIRAITIGQNLFKSDPKLTSLRNNLKKLQILKNDFNNHGIEVEYIRFASQTFSKTTDITNFSIFERREEILPILEGFTKENLLGIYAYTPGLCDQVESLTPMQCKIMKNIPDLIYKYPNMFTSIQAGSNHGGLSFEAIKESTKIIQRLSKPDPFQNVKFAVTFNVPPNTPFFPSAYHIGKSPTISIALEAADEVITVLKKNPLTTTNLTNVKKAIQLKFTKIFDQINDIAEAFCKKYEFLFKGIDLSPAPYPTKEKSIGTALEQLGLSKFGEPGTVFSVGFLTEALQSIDRPKIGFSGFMQPLLEDYTIARRNNETKIDISKLLLYSTMCGLGLDCIPIPGNLDPAAIQLLLMDLGMISLRLKKPLTARLMPITDRKAGEMTEFDFEYFINSKICDLPIPNSHDLNVFFKNNPSYLF
ncbi:DUF711 family protein [Promethearchaeum syntrophicum]|uniref:DUF711 family protein n=1 Tax=Promethearchaeum syntrophicum TaxID=2594042 RepID=A0A5B9D7Q8_9ARCH|nr:DUF711 family protein [Candidatus Prometheoarchaeum syntrophicum]QEE15219.1 hypothetical protein DSAG12_01043 [Candidatus Prometheoarchaeum syntrophicum]